MKLSDIKLSVAAQWEAGNACMIWGPPAIGKSDGVRQLAASQSYSVAENPAMAKLSKRLAEVYGHSFTGRRVYDVRLLLCDPTDIKGLPVYDPVDRRATWVMSGLFPMDPSTLSRLERELSDLIASHPDEKTRTPAINTRIDDLVDRIAAGLHDQHAVIFLDEIAAAPPSVQGAAFQLVLDRKIGTYTVPAGCRLIAAGNQQKHGAGAHRMLTPLTSRFCHYHMDKPSFDEWVDNFAIDAGIEPDIIGFLKFKPDSLFNFNPEQLKNQSEAANTTFASPRTWAFASKFIAAARATGLDNRSAASNALVASTLEGIVGAVATEFIQWRKLYRELPDPEAILDRKVKYDTISFERNVDGRTFFDVSLKYAFMLALINCLCKNKTPERCHTFLSFMLVDTKNIDFLTVCARSLSARRDPELIKTLIGCKDVWPKFAKAANFSGAISSAG